MLLQKKTYSPYLLRGSEFEFYKTQIWYLNDLYMNSFIAYVFVIIVYERKLITSKEN